MWRLALDRLCSNPSTNSLIFQRSYAVVGGVGGKLGKKKAGKLGGAVVEKKVHPVETDPEKLVNYVCGSNINKEGSDIKLRPDSEYPEWLWTLNTGKPKSIEELEPSSKEYWIKVRKQNLIRHNKLAKLKRF